MGKRRLSEQERISAAGGQRWKTTGALGERILTGPELLNRMERYGSTRAAYFRDSAIGDVFTSGVSAWERIK